MDSAIRREGYFGDKGGGQNYLHEHDDLLSCCLSPCLPDYRKMLRHDGPKEDGAIRLLFQVSDHLHVLAAGIPQLHEVLWGLRPDDLELNNRKHIGGQHLQQEPYEGDKGHAHGHLLLCGVVWSAVLLPYCWIAIRQCRSPLTIRLPWNPRLCIRADNYRLLVQIRHLKTLIYKFTL